MFAYCFGFVEDGYDFEPAEHQREQYERWNRKPDDGLIDVIADRKCAVIFDSSLHTVGSDCSVVSEFADTRYESILGRFVD